MKRKSKLVYGWGINDSETPVQRFAKGTRSLEWICPYYEKWKQILRRCLSNKFKLTRPSYNECTVCEEWRYFSNFVKWVNQQPVNAWSGHHLDKDVLVKGNKLYSSHTCAFVPPKVNAFILDNAGHRGASLLGTSLHKRSKMYQARIKDPFANKEVYLGEFHCELQAHKAWQAKKHEYACQLADLQDDPRVADALRQRYALDKDWTNK